MSENNTNLDKRFASHLAKELQKAREKFPDNDHMNIALIEEVGELSQAFLEYEHEGGEKERIWEEALQVATVAVRLATEGDASFSYDPAEYKE